MKNRDLLDWVPEIDAGAAQYGLKCEFIAAYVMHSLNDSGLHSDNHKHEARINFPILNCERTYLEYYSGGISRPHFSPHSSSTGTTTLITPDSTTKFLGAIEVNQVTVIRVNVPHSVKMFRGSPSPRITLTLGFDKDPVYLLEEDDTLSDKI
jgi:hypothetical protein